MKIHTLEDGSKSAHMLAYTLHPSFYGADVVSYCSYLMCFISTVIGYNRRDTKYLKLLTYCPNTPPHLKRNASPLKEQKGMAMVKQSKRSKILCYIRWLNAPLHVLE